MAVHFKSCLVASGIALFSAGLAQSAELCVKCSDPNASYACVVNISGGGMAETAAKLYCITALAKSGSHARCAIDRNSAPPCQGERKELPIPSVFQGGADDAPDQPDAPAAGTNASTVDLPTIVPSVAPPAGPADAAQQPPKDAAAEPPPKTVQEMVEKGAKSAGDGIAETQKSAGDAAKSAGTALQKAGTAVGDAAKNSWKCLSSFFSNCGSTD